jgi:cell division transport system permease protein
MRLVGASNWFIRGPFLVQGLICGLLAILLALPLFLILSFAVSPAIFNLTGGFNQFKYFIGHLPLIVLIQLLVGVGLGLISGLVAVGRYLKK